MTLKKDLKIFLEKKNKSTDDWYEFISALFGGFPELKTFGNRASKFLRQSSYDVVIDNQSLSFGMIEVQKNYP